MDLSQSGWKSDPRPNVFQKLLHRFVMIRPVTDFFAPRVNRIDQAILKLTNGKHTGAELLGWPIVQLITTGARTRRPRAVPLIGIPDSERIILIATSFGRKHNPNWYYNLKAYPECDVLFKGQRRKYIAREAGGDEYDQCWRMALTYYAGFDKYKERAADRHIPAIVLELKK